MPKNLFLFFLFYLFFSLVIYAEANPVEIGIKAMKRGHFATALNAWLPEAKKGNPRAQNNVGYAYEKGNGVSQSYNKAMNWYRMAAESDLAEANHNIGMLYFNGYGVEKIYTEAARWFTRAAKKELADSQFMIGRLYHEGLGVPPDSKKALQWYTKAAKQGYVKAQFLSSYILLSDDAGGSYPYQARVWAELAKIHGYKDADLMIQYCEFKLEELQIEKAKLTAKNCLSSGYKDCF